MYLVDIFGNIGYSLTPVSTWSSLHQVGGMQRDNMYHLFYQNTFN